jgi:hypothetical protein
MGRAQEWTFVYGRYTDGQEAHKEMQINTKQDATSRPRGWLGSRRPVLTLGG